MNRDKPGLVKSYICPLPLGGFQLAPRFERSLLRQTYSVRNNSATGILRRVLIFSIVSNDGALIPRSTRLRKSTEIPIVSANRS